MCIGPVWESEMGELERIFTAGEGCSCLVSVYKESGPLPLGH